MIRKAVMAYFQGFGPWFWGWMISEVAFLAGWTATGNWGWQAALLAGLAIGPIVTFHKYYTKKEEELGDSKRRADESEHKLKVTIDRREHETQLGMFLAQLRALRIEQVALDELEGWEKRVQDTYQVLSNYLGNSVGLGKAVAVFDAGPLSDRYPHACNDHHNEMICKLRAVSNRLSAMINERT